MFRKLLLFALSLMVTPSYAVDCSRYLGKGYCTDYIKSQTGQKQSGDAQDWQGDHDLSKLVNGDVAIFDFGTYGHVALVDKVNRDAAGVPISVDLSEWNYGSTYTDKACAVTNEFGVLRNSRTLPVSNVDRFWHIGSESITIQTTCSGIYCWAPQGSLCENASSWYRLDDIPKVQKNIFKQTRFHKKTRLKRMITKEDFQKI